MEEKITSKQQPASSNGNVRNDWKAVVDKISYQGIVNNIPFLIFLVILCVIYITNNQRTIDTQRLLNKRNEELKELRWRYMDIKSQVMNAGMETEVIKGSASIGIKPLTLPAYRIEKDSLKRVN
jgi:hypothetical protein